MKSKQEEHFNLFNELEESIEELLYCCSSNSSDVNIELLTKIGEKYFPELDKLMIQMKE